MHNYYYSLLCYYSYFFIRCLILCKNYLYVIAWCDLGPTPLRSFLHFMYVAFLAAIGRGGHHTAPGGAGSYPHPLEVALGFRLERSATYLVPPP